MTGRIRIGSRSLIGAVAISIVAGLGSGCFAPDIAPVALTSPGWRSSETPVVWRPSTKSPELTGELLLASHEDGSRFIQFSKGGLPVVVAQQSAVGWRISSSLRSGTFGGRGSPPSSVAWFQLRSIPPTSMSPPWVLTNLATGGWVVVHPRTGEMLEGPGNP